MTNNSIADALLETLRSANETDQNLEAANIVDGLFAIARALNSVAGAIRDCGLDKMVGQLDALHSIASSIEQMTLKQ